MRLRSTCSTGEARSTSPWWRSFVTSTRRTEDGLIASGTTRGRYRKILPMRILFAVSGALRQGPAGPASDLASARYRVLIPAQGLVRLGHEVQIATPGPGGWPPAAREAKPDVLVVSKSFDPATEELARAMK